MQVGYRTPTIAIRAAEAFRLAIVGQRSERPLDQAVQWRCQRISFLIPSDLDERAEKDKMLMLVPGSHPPKVRSSHDLSRKYLVSQTCARVAVKTSSELSQPWRLQAPSGASSSI